MDDDDDFLAAIEEDNKAGAVVPDEPEAPKEPVAEPEPTPEPVPEPEPEPQPSETPKQAEPGYVPLTALLETRDKARAAEERATKAEERAAKIEADMAQSRVQQPQPMPDPIEDPEGFATFQSRQVQSAVYETNLRWSERIAKIEHGAETVEQAKGWGIERCNSDPYFNAKVAASPDPVGFVVKEWQREQIASQVSPDDYKQFQAWKAAQAQVQASAPPQPAATPNQPRSVPPRSLASAPSAGGVLTEPEPSEEDIFAGAFKR